jgi:hypothetical protein
MGSVLRSLVVLTITALTVVASPRADAAVRGSVRNVYDGRWTVVIYTLRGDCDRALRYSVRIAGGRVLAEDQSYQLYGAVAPSGAIRVTVAEGGRSANGAGRLVGNSGRGLWRTSSGECSGQWTAQRRTAN